MCHLALPGSKPTYFSIAAVHHDFSDLHRHTHICTCTYEMLLDIDQITATVRYSVNTCSHSFYTNFMARYIAFCIFYPKLVETVVTFMTFTKASLPFSGRNILMDVIWRTIQIISYPWFSCAAFSALDSAVFHTQLFS